MGQPGCAVHNRAIAGCFIPPAALSVRIVLKQRRRKARQAGATTPPAKQ